MLLSNKKETRELSNKEIYNRGMSVNESEKGIHLQKYVGFAAHSSNRAAWDKLQPISRSMISTSIVNTLPEIILEDDDSFSYDYYKDLEKFVRYFVSVSETSLFSYHHHLIEKIPKSGKWAELVGWVLRITSTGAMIGVGMTGMEPVKLGAALGLSFLEVIVTNIGAYQNRQKLKRLINILEIFQKDREENKNEIRKNLILAGFFLFQSFEIRFKELTVHGSREVALLKLTRGAADRMFHYFRKNVSEDTEVFSVENIIRAVMLGKSRRYRGPFLLPNMHLGYSLDNRLTTHSIFEETPIFKLNYSKVNFSYKRYKPFLDRFNFRPVPYFRLIFNWEEDTLTDDVDWGVDRNIVLAGKQYVKSTLFTPSTLDKLKLAYLSEDEFQEIETTLFNAINVDHEAGLEEVAQNELAKLRDAIKQDTLVMINKVEKHMVNIEKILLLTIESLSSVQKEQVEMNKRIQNIKDSLKNRRFSNSSYESCVEIGLELRLEESIRKKIRYYLNASIDQLDDSKIYVLPQAFSDNKILIKENEFSLICKVVNFIKDSEKKILMILGESGSGKTSFSKYLVKSILDEKMLSVLNFPIIPIYIRLANFLQKKGRNNLIEWFFKNCYKLTRGEELLLKSTQTSFCFIMDGLDELEHIETDLNLLKELQDNFPSSCCIFTAMLNKSRSKEECEKLLLKICNGEFSELKRLQDDTITIAGFDKVSKINYISQFININPLCHELNNVDKIYNYINKIPFFMEIVSRPIFMMITMKVFFYLDRFYSKENMPSSKKELQRDLFHIYTHLIYRQIALKIKQKEGIKDIDGKSIYECIMDYSVRLAKFMHDAGLSEIKRSQLLGEPGTLTSDTSSISDESESAFPLSLMPAQSKEYQQFFARKYNSQLFDDRAHFETFKFGFKGCEFLQSLQLNQEIFYSFKHNYFLKYFQTLQPEDMDRRNKIIEFIEPQFFSKGLSKQKISNPLSVPKKSSGNTEGDSSKNWSRRFSERSIVAGEWRDARDRSVSFSNSIVKTTTTTTKPFFRTRMDKGRNRTFSDSENYPSFSGYYNRAVLLGQSSEMSHDPTEINLNI